MSSTEFEFEAGVGSVCEEVEACEVEGVVVDAEGVGDAVAVGFAGGEGVVVVAAAGVGEVESEGDAGGGGLRFAMLIDVVNGGDAGEGAGVLGEPVFAAPVDAGVGAEFPVGEWEGEGHEGDEVGSWRPYAGYEAAAL
jgi:hypothetical protein